MGAGLKQVVFLLTILVCATQAHAQDSLRSDITLLRLKEVHPSFSNSSPLALPKDLPTKNFGFFCQQELQLSRKNIPLRFRLGSMEYCNYLEQKPGYKLAPASR